MTSDQGNETPAGPVEASGVIGSVATVANTNLVTILLGRSLKAAGDYLGEISEDFFKKLRDARQKNITDHITKVADVTGVPVDIPTSQFVRIERWFRVAADVPLEDAERSAVVEAALTDIVSNIEDAPEFQEAAEKLTRNSARLLLNSPAEQSIAPSDADERGFEQLKSLGLATTPGKTQYLADLSALFVGTVVGLIALFGVVIRYAPRFLPRSIPISLATEFVVEAIAITAVTVGFGIFLMSTRYRLTHLGRSLQNSAKRFYRNQSKQPRVSFLTIIPGPSWLMWGTLAAFLVCMLPFALQAYLPPHLRIAAQPPTLIISSPPAEQGNAAPPPSAPSATQPKQPGVTLSADDVRMLADFWRSVADQMSAIIDVTNATSAVLRSWPQRIKDGKSTALNAELLKERNAINQHLQSLTSLYNAYQTYPNVRAVLENPVARGFGRLYQALDSFATEVGNLGTPAPDNYENTLSPYADELKRAVGQMVKWATSTRDFAARQSDELSQTDHR